MNPGDPRTLLDRHAPRVLGRWREHLRALPPSSALATHELLTPLMASVLARVRQELPARSSNSLAKVEPPPCRCGLNPLAAFYLTGECATFDVLWAQPEALATLPGAKRESVCHALSEAWHRVAAEELALFCGACQRGAQMLAEEAIASAAKDATEKIVAAAKTSPAPLSAVSESGKVAAEPVRDRLLATARRFSGTPG